MLVKHLRRWVRGRMKGDAGSTLVTVLIIMLVLSVGGIAIAGLVTSSTVSLAQSNSRLQAQAAVDAGIAAQTARLETGVLECGASATEAVGDDATSPEYEFAFSCNANTATLSVDATVDGATVKRQAVFTINPAGPPPTAGGPGMFYANQLSHLSNYEYLPEHSEVDIDDFAGASGVYVSNGNLACWDSNGVFPGIVYLKSGNLTLGSGCSVDSDVFVGGSFTIQGGSQVTGNVFAAGTGQNTLGDGTVQGNFTYRGTFTTWSAPVTSRVKGAVTKDATLTPSKFPPIPDWQDVAFTPVSATIPPQAWADAGYGLTVVTGAACSKWRTSQEDVSSVFASQSGPMVYDVRGCTSKKNEHDFTTNDGGQKLITLTHDTAIIADSWYLSGARIESNGNVPRTLYLVTPDGNAAQAGPQCESPAAGSEMGNTSIVEPEVAVYIYTPCQVKMNSAGNVFRGQIYAGDLSFQGGGQIAFAPRNIPGYDFGEAVTPPPTPGGGTGETTVTLISTHDVMP